MTGAPSPRGTLVQRLARRRRESSIQSAVLRVFRAYRIICYPLQRERAGKRRASHIGFPGIPDIGGTLPGGRSLYCEVKRPGEQPRLHQVVAMRTLAKQGAFVCLVHSVEEAEQAAKEATRRDDG